MADTVAYVRSVEQLLIDALADLGLPGAGRLDGYPGVWVDPDGRRPPQDRGHRRAARPGADRCTASPSTSTPTWRMFDHIVPCGIADKAVTSLARGGRRRHRCARWSTRSPPGPPSGGGRAGGVDRRRRRLAAPAPPTWRRSAAARARASRSARRSPAGDRPCACGAGWPRPGSPTGLPIADAQARRGCGRRCASAPTYLRLQAHDARPRPRHRVRGGRLPEHLSSAGPTAPPPS